jgi:hypothetical protein
VASVGRFLGETRDSRRGSAQWIEAEAERGENEEGSRDRLERVEMEEGGWGDRRPTAAREQRARAAAWLTSRGIERSS